MGELSARSVAHAGIGSHALDRASNLTDDTAIADGSHLRRSSIHLSRTQTLICMIVEALTARTWKKRTCSCTSVPVAEAVPVAARARGGTIASIPEERMPLLRGHGRLRGNWEPASRRPRARRGERDEGDARQKRHRRV